MSPTMPTALASEHYIDPGIFAEEKRALFYRTWQFAGHVSQIPRQGDFLTFEICNQSMFLLRHGDDIRAFHNVCMHRAHQLVEGNGNVSSIVCPYHAWTYNLDGTLRRAPNQDKVPGFDAGSIGLTEVRTETFLGFVFVNLDPGSPAMDTWYPGARSELRAFLPDVDRLAPVRWIEVREACNWKVTVENYSECYHCRKNHKTFVEGVVDPNTYNIMPQGHCLRHTTQSVDLERMTYPIDAEANAHATDYSSWFLWPTFSFQVYPGNVLNTYHWRALGVETTLAVRGWYTVDGKTSDLVESLAVQDQDTTLAEDVRLVESVQRGLNSLG